MKNLGKFDGYKEWDIMLRDEAWNNEDTKNYTTLRKRSICLKRQSEK